jgi:hypothetical protein
MVLAAGETLKQYLFFFINSEMVFINSDIIYANEKNTAANVLTAWVESAFFSHKLAAPCHVPETAVI